MSQNVTLFQIFGTKLRLPFMFGSGLERLSGSAKPPTTPDLKNKNTSSPSIPDKNKKKRQKHQSKTQKMS